MFFSGVQRRIFHLIVGLLVAGCVTPVPEGDAVEAASSDDAAVVAVDTGAEQESQERGEDITEQALDALVLADGSEELPSHLKPIYTTYTADFDGMVERRAIRALVTYSLTNYFLDGPDQKGISYDALQLFEKSLNEKLGMGTLKLHVVIVPVARDQLIPGLLSGIGDLAVANLTVTPERLQDVDFSDPFATDVSELVVTGPSAPELASLDDLAGREVHVRASSSYHESLLKLNERFVQEGKEPMQLVAADEHFEDEDLLQMVNAGVLPMVVVDSHKANFWAEIFEKITVRDDLAVATGQRIAWAFRKNSPKLAAEVNAFVKENKRGTLMGNILIKRYLKNTKWVEEVLSEAEVEKFDQTMKFFKTYGDRYEFDWLMTAALGYQESRLDQSVRSSVGAVGIMQLLPTTAADQNVGIPNIEEAESNIHAGTKYLRFLYDRYFKDDEEVDDLNKMFFTMASYNAGPARVRGLRQKAEQRGLDPNVWFDNVEVVAAKEIGRETVQYVSNIYKYYVSYSLLRDQRIEKGESF